MKTLQERFIELVRSDFDHHSQNIRKFARSKKFGRNNWRIVREAWNRFDGDCDIEDGDLFFAYSTDQFIVGVRVNDVRCGRFEIGAHCIHGKIRDETEWFVERYSKLGMCAFGDDFNHKWNVKDGHVGTYRFCTKCGKREVKRSKKVEKTWWEDAS